MRRIVIGLIFVVLFGICFVACSKQNKQLPENDSDGCSVAPTLTANVSGELPTQMITPSPVLSPTEEAHHQITWGVYFWNRPKEESWNEINRLLMEKGYDCSIRFILEGVAIESELEEWVHDTEETYGSLDIFSCGVWNSLSEGNTFAKNHFMPLNEYLKTEDGMKIWNNYCQGAWDQVTDKDGIIYTVPRASSKTANYKNFNRGIYLSVQRKYEDYFAEFDGTYIKLREIYESIGDASLRIVMQNTNDNTLYGMMGYQDYYGIPYDPLNHCFVDMTQSTIAKDTISLVTQDILCDEKLEVWDLSTTPDSNVLAYIHTGIQSDTEERKEFCMAKDPYIVNYRMCYGVSKNSEQKQLALKILSVCFSDPEIMMLMQPDTADVEYAEERLALMKDEHAEDFCRFESCIGPESEKALLKYSNLFGWSVLNHETLAYNRNFTPEEFLEKLETEEYHAIIEELNCEMKEHLARN